MDLQYCLSFIGSMTILGIVFLIGVFLWEFATDWIRTLKWQYKYKHRFDKPPTAQCYCKDCRYYKLYDLKNNCGRCGRGHIENWTVADNYFCWQAEPLKKEPEMVDSR